MSWTAPRTFFDGETETAAIFNTHLRDNLLFIDPTLAIWTPTITGTGGSSGQTYTNRDGHYSRFGRTIFFEGRIVLSAVGTVTGSVVIGGLPVVSDAGATLLNGVVLFPYFAAMTTSVMWIGGYIQPGTSQIVLTQRITAGVATANLVQADLSATTDLVFGGFYFTA